MSRLPTPGQDNGTWGAILNDYLSQAHTSDGSLKPGSVGASQVQDGSLPKTKLDTTAQASLTKADGSLQASNNLSDLAAPATARTNLGLGTAATMTPASLAADSAFSGTYGLVPLYNTAANLASTNPTPAIRQLAFESDTGLFKVGNGSTAYNSLPYETVADGSITPAKLSAPIAFGRLSSGIYYFCNGANSTGTNGTQGNGVLRLTPWYVPNQITITRIGGEIVTAGDVGSVVRLGIYADTGSGYAGALVLDAGTINGNSATVQEITINQVLAPGQYWVGGVVQNVVTTQPVVRTTTESMRGLPVNTAIPTANQVLVGLWAGSSITGALPSTYPSTLTPSTSAIRVFVKVA